MNQTWNQETFDKEFISASEIYKFLEIERSTLHHAVINGKMPEPISMPTTSIWVRREVEPILKEWYLMLQKRRRIN